ncbi:tyrosine-type recombinase/integrase [Pantoea agglomerans]|uniref:tyrosine-type recombinase/integrase n=1 Tax=Enterobacter agglomerans TaxID=549 RepID=UPI00178500FE|nr:tyrosine-type recombinase/integrase [Pantoea agglomerans]MBD8234847.1 tyrosine-type recombinase/integrase [Pantoea agglomerans]
MLIPPDEHVLLLAERWLKLLSDLGRAPATLTAYRSALHHYFAFCRQSRIAPEKAQFEDLAAYISPQLPGMPFPAASATLQLRLSAIRLWYDFLVYQDICSLNPLPRAGLPGVIYTGRGLVPRITRLPVIPDSEQWLRFLKHVSDASLRDRLMLALAYFGALRRAEVTALTLEDIDPAHRLIRIRPETTKSRRERVVCYGPDVTPVLANHFRQLKQAGRTKGALFRSFSDRNYGTPLSVWNWSKTVRRWALDAGLPHITTHTFRHLRLTHLARAGWKLHELATYAGHRDPRTTQIYIHLSGSDLAGRITAAVAETDRKVARLIFQENLTDE